eukprot:g1530.t1
MSFETTICLAVVLVCFLLYLVAELYKKWMIHVHFQFRIQDNQDSGRIDDLYLLKNTQLQARVVDIVSELEKVNRMFEWPWQQLWSFQNIIDSLFELHAMPIDELISQGSSICSNATDIADMEVMSQLENLFEKDPIEAISRNIARRGGSIRKVPRTSDGGASTKVHEIQGFYSNSTIDDEYFDFERDGAVSEGGGSSDGVYSRGTGDTLDRAKRRSGVKAKVWFSHRSAGFSPPDVEKILDWTNFDIFEYASTNTKGHMFTELFGTIFGMRFDVIEPLNISPTSICQMLGYAQASYEDPLGKPNGFHNALHAADTMVAAAAIFVEVSKFAINARQICPEMVYALGVAALLHDYRHPGVQNGFIKNSRHPVALRYAGDACLERMHSAEAMELLAREGCLPCDSEAFETFRYLCTEMILGTHFTRGVKTMNEVEMAYAQLRRQSSTRKTVSATRMFLNAVVPVSASPVSPSVSPAVSPAENPILPEKALCSMLCFIVQCADVSYSAKPLKIHQRWAVMAKEEFLEQGRLEKQLKLPISSMCDINCVDTWPKTMKGFVKYYAAPKFRVLSSVCVWNASDDFIMRGTATCLQWTSLTSKNNNFWGVGGTKTKFKVLRKTLMDEKPNFAAICERVRKAGLFTEGSDHSTEMSLAAADSTTHKNTWQRLREGALQANAYMKKKNEKWHNTRLARLARKYEQFLLSVKPFPGFTDEGVVDQWPVGRLRDLGKEGENISKTNVDFANKLEKFLEAAKVDGVRKVDVDLLVFDRDKGLSRISVKGSAAGIAKSQHLVDEMLSLDKTSMLLECPEWHSTRINALFVSLDAYRRRIKHIPKFLREKLSSLSGSDMKHARNEKKKIDHVSEATGRNVQEVMKEARSRGVKHLSFEATLPTPNYLRGTMQAFSGSPDELLENGKLHDAIMGFDAWNFLEDPHAVRQKLSLKERVILHARE